MLDGTTEPYPLLANRLLFSSEAIGVTMAVGRTGGYHLCAQTTGGINRAPAQGLLDHDTNVFALNTFREGLTVADRSEETAGRGRNSRNLPCVILIEVMRVALPQIQIAHRN